MNNIYISKMVINHVPFFNKVDKLVITGGGSPEPIKYPNNEIHYKTTNNEIVYPDSGYTWFDGLNIVSNEYVPELDHCVLTTDGDVVRFGEGFFASFQSNNLSVLEEIIWLPSTIEDFNQRFLSVCNFLKKINLKNITKPKSLPMYFLLRQSNSSIKYQQLEELDLRSMYIEDISDRIISGYTTSPIKVLKLGQIADDNFTRAKMETLRFLSDGNTGTSEKPGVEKFVIENDTVAKNFFNNVFTQNTKRVAEGIYVPDHLVEEYKIQVPLWADFFKPLSEYTE